MFSGDSVPDLNEVLPENPCGELRAGKRPVCIGSSDMSDEEIVYDPGKNGISAFVYCILHSER
jgi:hypothetical protein